MKLYKEIGMPPLPNNYEKQNGDLEQKQQPTIEKKQNNTINVDDDTIEHVDLTNLNKFEQK